MNASSPSNSPAVLVDTRVVVSHFRAGNSTLKTHLEAGGVIYLPLTVLGELFAGACRVVRRDHALQQINSFASLSRLLLPDENTALHYGEIYAELAQAGTLIPQNDIWIAAFAREHHLPVVTSDAHFAQVRALTILDWR